MTLELHDFSSTSPLIILFFLLTGLSRDQKLKVFSNNARDIPCHHVQCVICPPRIKLSNDVVKDTAHGEREQGVVIFGSAWYLKLVNITQTIMTFLSAGKL